MTMYKVRVREDYRWSSARVAGYNFSKAGEAINEANLTDGIRNSPLLVVEEVPEEKQKPKPKRKRPVRRPKIEGEEVISDPQSNNSGNTDN